jgi:hypothetical protein
MQPQGLDATGGVVLQRRHGGDPVWLALENEPRVTTLVDAEGEPQLEGHVEARNGRFS